LSGGPERARAVYDRNGFLFWLRDGSLVARRFDPATGAFAGDTFVVDQRVGTDPNKTAQDLFGVGGGVIATRLPSSAQRVLRWFERDGTPAEIVAPEDGYYDPDGSPDRSAVAVARSPSLNYFVADIWIFDATATNRSTRLTFDGSSSTPIWSPDGATIYYSSSAGGRYRLLAKRVDGSGEEQLVLDSKSAFWPDSISPREQLLALEGPSDDGQSYRLWLLPLQGERKLVPFAPGLQGSQTHAAFSPDGRLIAYSSDESGLPQVYVQPVDGSTGRWQVSRDGGDLAVWRADGKELYYVGLDRGLRAVPVESLEPFRIGDEAVLFPLRVPPIAITSQHAYYLPSADGRRFLANVAVDEGNNSGIRVTLGWTPSSGAEAR